MTDAPDNNDTLARFRHYVAGLKPTMQAQYGQQLTQDLSLQHWDGCFQRNVLAVIAQAYDGALAYLQTLPFDSGSSPINQGRSDMTQQALTAFDGFVDEFLLFVVDKHRTSCALSNFPGEHKPDKAYVNEVRHGIAALWRDFALAANAYILECR